MVEHIVHTDGVVGSNPAVRTISRRLEKRLVSSAFILMHEYAYNNYIRTIEWLVLKRTEVNQKWFSFDSVLIQ